MIRGPGRPTKYVTKDGTKVVGTTTVINRFKDSGALMQWAFKQGQSGASTLYESRDVAADVGTLIHDMIEADIHGTDGPKIPEQHAIKCASGFSAWLQWKAGRGFEIVATEVPLVSEAYRYGGTLDAVARDTNGLCLFDWKSSNAVYSDYALQLAAYRVLWDEHHPDDPITGGFHLARFSKEHGDMEHRYWPDLKEAEEEFLLLVKAYELDKKLQARIK